MPQEEKKIIKEPPPLVETQIPIKQEWQGLVQLLCAQRIGKPIKVISFSEESAQPKAAGQKLDRKFLEFLRGKFEELTLVGGDLSLQHIEDFARSGDKTFQAATHLKNMLQDIRFGDKLIERAFEEEWDPETFVDAVVYFQAKQEEAETNGVGGIPTTAKESVLTTLEETARAGVGIPKRERSKHPEADTRAFEEMLDSFLQAKSIQTKKGEEDIVGQAIAFGDPRALDLQFFQTEVGSDLRLLHDRMLGRGGRVAQEAGLKGVLVVFRDGNFALYSWPSTREGDEAAEDAYDIFVNPQKTEISLDAKEHPTALAIIEGLGRKTGLEMLVGSDEPGWRPRPELRLIGKFVLGEEQLDEAKRTALREQGVVTPERIRELRMAFDFIRKAAQLKDVAANDQGQTIATDVEQKIRRIFE